MQLNETQKQAAEHFEGPMMVLAGPGSGKTTVITQRVKNLIEMHGVNPASILVITFTRSAAREMRERFLRLAGRKLPVTFGTFHAVFFMILKHAYGYRASDIISGEEQYQFLRGEIRRMHMETEDEHELITSVLAEISSVKNADLSPEHYYAVSCAQDAFRALYGSYQSFLAKNRRIDFDDMLLYCRELLSQRPDILAGWQGRWPFLLIDEFQDIGPVQYEVIRLLAGERQNLFVVGDDDQSIYRFRGAKPEIMLHMKKDFPRMQTVTLSVNYRCPRKIVQLSGRLIANNRTRFSKEIHAFSGAAGTVRSLTFAGQREENLYVAQMIQRRHAQGFPYCETAVLYRTNRQPLRLMECLMRYNIPFRTKERMPNLYDHWIAKDVLCYIRLALGSRSRRDFLQIMNRPKRYLSRDSLPDETVDFSRWEQYYRQMDWMARRVRKLKTDLEMIARLDPYGAVTYIRLAVDYEGYLKEIAGERGINPDELSEILDELQESARSFDSCRDWLTRIAELKKELADSERERERTADGKDAVVLSTLHGAKGLEYDQVFITEVNEGFLPYRKSVLDADLEEERRLLYVGMTRAKRELTLCTCREINNHDVKPSRFLAEMFSENTE